MFRSWSRRDKIHAALLLLITIGAVGHHCALFNWYIEDAAIDFAYAKHFVAGEGLVPYPGSERVEGYSNPTWLAILVLVQAIGVNVGFDLFQAVHWVQLLFVIPTVPLVYLAAREAAGRDSDVPIVAATFLGANTQFAIWGVCGLENALLHFLMALGLWRMLVEVRTGRWPWSAVVWMLVALTRPEGIVYAAVAGFCSMVFQLHARRPVWPTLAWLATFFVPYGLYQVWHYSYFAWPLPNTYYAKLDKKESIYEWNLRPWKWTRSFFQDMGQALFLPIWILGVVGEGRWRTVVAAATFLVVGLMLELSDDQRLLLPVVVGALWIAFWLGLKATEERPPRWLVGAATVVAAALIGVSELLRYEWHMQPNQIPWVPELLKTSPPTVLTALAVLLPLVGFRARGWQARLVSWLFCCTSIFFAVYAQGDWMKGYRWYSPASVPGALLFAWGVDSFVRIAQDMAGRARDSASWTLGGSVLAAVLVLLQLPANVWQTWTVALAPDASPRGIKPRVDYVDRLRDRLHLEERLVDLDVDQGAHLYWSDFEMMDIAGLVDLPLAHHRFEKEFVREYVFVERKPPYAHVHGSWASHSKIPSMPEWRRDYVEVPGYPAGKTLHPGNFLRKDAILGHGWTAGDEGRVAMEDGVVVHGVLVPSEPASGRKVYVEVGLSSTKARRGVADDFRVVLFAAPAAGGPAVQAWDLPPGYDWLLPHDWPVTSSFRGRFTLSVPEAALPPGTYDLGVVVFRKDGTVLPPLAGDEADAGPAVTVGGVPRYAPGEVVWPGVLRVLTVEERGQACTQDFDATLAHAEALRCDEAEESWRLARRHRAGEDDWAAQHVDRISRALASCWARSSDGQEREERHRRLVRAREWDWHEPAYRERAVPLAEELYAEGLVAREAQDWKGAYALFTDCVDVDRTRVWCRRYAEEARAWRLGFDPDSLAQRKADDAEKKRKAAENRKKFDEQAKARKAAAENEEAEE